MLTRSWGSCRTTVMLMMPTGKVRSAESGMRSCNGRSFAPRRPLVHSALHTPHSALCSSHQLQHTHPCYILPVAPHEHPAVAAAPDQLPGAAGAARQHLVHEQIEPEPPADVRALPPPRPPGDAERHAVPPVGAPPRASHAVRI